MRKIILVAIIEILILITLPASVSYLLNKNDLAKDFFSSEIRSVSAEVIFGNTTGEEEDELPEWKRDLYNKFSDDYNASYSTEKYFETTHSIANVGWNCCPLSKDGSICQSVFPGYENCLTEVLLASCSDVDGCKTGCCYDSEEGLCATNAPKIECESDSGIWKESENCQIEECRQGCCLLKDDVEFVTDQRCGTLSENLGIEKDFRSYKTELECLLLKETQSYGACVLENNLCRFVSESQCFNLNGQFHENYLCSNPSLDTTCEKQETVRCAENKDEIYWFDSCGNRENIYSSDKDASWNNGFVLNKSESCNSNSGNIESEDCGNCNYALGSICTETSGDEKTIKDGNFICKNLNCIDPETGDERKNGESWCVYDGYIGDGKDTVGSRHWKRMCINGEIKEEPCADYRGQICVQAELKNEKQETFTTSQCIINEALSCIQLSENECEKNTQCMLKTVNVDSGFRFDVCVGRYPRGFDLSPENEMKAEQKLCGLASQECKVVYVKGLTSGWNCDQNCNCLNPTFAEQMNDLCISLGDCGSYVNYVGDGTNNIKVTHSKTKLWEDYINYSNPVEGQYAEPGNLSEILRNFGVPDAEGEYNPLAENDLEKAETIVGQTSGAIGTVVMAAEFAVGTEIGAGVYGSLFPSSIQAGSGAVAFSPAVSAIGTIAMAAGIGMMVGGFIANHFDIQGQAASAMMIAGAVGGAGLAAWASSYAWLSALGPYAVIAAVVVMAIIIISGWGSTREVIVDFECRPWTPPFGGENCDLCDSDSLTPCSEYKCNSLGRACQFINKNSETPSCVALENDLKPPIITPLNISEGYEFQNSEQDRVSIRTDNGKCIPEFTPVKFTLETDEYALCKFSLEREKEFDEIENLFEEGNIFTTNHSSTIFVPSLDSLMVHNVTGDIRERFGNMNYFVTCADAYGDMNAREYTVNFCIRTGEDITPARFFSTNPENNSIIEHGLESKKVVFSLNEPAECKWSKTPDKEYYEMENSMNCVTDVLDYGYNGWECETNLDLEENQTNLFYIKCKDQPWLSPEDEKRNINSEDIIYVLRNSKSELKISEKYPSGNVVNGFEPVNLKLQITTSGGAENGNAICSYSFEENSTMTEFFATGSYVHEQKLNLLKGNYKIYLRCKDIAGNIVEDILGFNLKLDTSPPEVVRAYNSGDRLNVLTDEKAECYYTLDRCNFDLDSEEAKKMTSAFSKNHYATWEDGVRYYIKCRDIWGNTNPECAIKLKAE
ncbi:hypothetical protein K9L16_01495 [Candidatus Pacearchaeota archaeon]|nr:hypothetical protein [Candidatus Pacearchaeota archaeon]